MNSTWVFCIFLQLMNNPPADASERPGKFPKYNKETYRMQKVLAQKADKIGMVVNSGPQECGLLNYT